MAVEQSKLKGRRPSPVLWAMVRRLTDEQWRELKAFSQAHGKNTVQFKLLEFLRTMAKYDPDKEKREFASHNLTSMRNTARRWLINTSRRLGFYETEVQSLCLDVDVLIEWQMWEQAMEYIKEAKKLASEQEEFSWLTMLYEQEIKVAKAFLKGNQRTKAIARLSKLALRSAKMKLLEMKIQAQSAQYIECPQVHFNETGKLEIAISHAYFDSQFFKSAIHLWPITFQLEKLRIDEANYYYLGDNKNAIKIALQRLELFARNESIRRKMPSEHSKILFRLTAYYHDTGNLDASREILHAFRSLNPLAEGNRKHYLRHYLYAIFRLALEAEDEALGMEATKIWEDAQSFILSLPFDRPTIVAILFACAFYVATGEIPKARTAVNFLLNPMSSFSEVPVHAVFKMLHMIVLLEEEDDRGLQSYGNNYKRYLKSHPQSTSLPLEMIMLLSKPKQREDPEKFSTALEAIVNRMKEMQESDKTTFRPFIKPLIRWANSRLKPRNPR